MLKRKSPFQKLTIFDNKHPEAEKLSFEEPRKEVEDRIVRNLQCPQWELLDSPFQLQNDY